MQSPKLRPGRRRRRTSMLSGTGPGKANAIAKTDSFFHVTSIRKRMRLYAPASERTQLRAAVCKRPPGRPGRRTRAHERMGARAAPDVVICIYVGFPDYGRTLTDALLRTNMRRCPSGMRPCVSTHEGGYVQEQAAAIVVYCRYCCNCRCG